MCKPEDTLERKRTLRRKVIARRDAIPEEARRTKSRCVCQRITEEFKRVCTTKAHPTIAVYAAMNSEVDLEDFIECAYECGARVAFPCMSKAEQQDKDEQGNQQRGKPERNKPPVRPSMVMRSVSYEQYHAQEVPFITTPIRAYATNDVAVKNYPAVSPEEVDFAVIPMVAFDDSLMRLGYGGGNYDSFLSETRSDAAIVGAAFDEQHVVSVPAEDHDLRLPNIAHA